MEEGGLGGRLGEGNVREKPVHKTKEHSQVLVAIVIFARMN